MAVCDKWVALKIVEFLFCVACLVTKRISQDDEARLGLLLQKLSREWSLLTSVTWDSAGGAFADAMYGGYVIITFALIVGRVFQELPRGRRLLEGVLLGLGMLFFLILGGLELASLDSIPRSLTVNAAVLGTLTLVVAALFLVDLMAPRVYTAARHAQTDPFSSPRPEKKVSIVAPPTTVSNGVNGHVTKKETAERPKNLDLEKGKETKIDDSKEQTSPKDQIDSYKISDIDKDELVQSKFGSLRNGFENGNYVRLSDPIADNDRLHYEKELTKFNEWYFKEYLDQYEGKLIAKENYLPELQTPVFAKIKTSRSKSLYDDASPTDKQPKSPIKKTIPSPTLQQLEDYLKGSRGRRSDTPALFPMEPIKEREGTDADRASGTPTDPGYVQYTAGRWNDKARELRTPRHSPTQ